MREPVGPLLAHEDIALRGANLRQLIPKLEVGNDVPVGPIVYVERHDLRTAFLHLEAEIAGGTTHIENALSLKAVVA